MCNCFHFAAIECSKSFKQMAEIKAVDRWFEWSCACPEPENASSDLRCGSVVFVKLECLGGGNAYGACAI